MRAIRAVALITMVLLVFTACGKKTETNLTKQTGSETEVTQNNNETQRDSKEITMPSPDGSKQSASSLKPEQIPAAPQTQASTQAPITIKGKVVVLDPGHANRSNLETEPIAPGSTVMKIKDGGGAQGIGTRTPEYLVNMEVSKRLKTLLEQMGFTVVMTKTDNSVSLGNIERAEIGNKANASLVVRIHADSNDNSSISGASMLIPQAINENTQRIYSESNRYG